MFNSKCEALEYFLNDLSLSPLARLLIMHLTAQPQQYFTRPELEQIIDCKDKKTRVILKELRQAGYLEYYQQRSQDGKRAIGFMYRRVAFLPAENQDGVLCRSENYQDGVLCRSDVKTALNTVQKSQDGIKHRSEEKPPLREVKAPFSPIKPVPESQDGIKHRRILLLHNNIKEVNTSSSSKEVSAQARDFDRADPWGLGIVYEPYKRLFQGKISKELNPENEIYFCMIYMHDHYQQVHKKLRGSFDDYLQYPDCVLDYSTRENCKQVIGYLQEVLRARKKPDDYPTVLKSFQYILNNLKPKGKQFFKYKNIFTLSGIKTYFSEADEIKQKKARKKEIDLHAGRAVASPDQQAAEQLAREIDNIKDQVKKAFRYTQQGRYPKLWPRYQDQVNAYVVALSKESCLPYHENIQETLQAWQDHGESIATLNELMLKMPPKVNVSEFRKLPEEPKQQADNVRQLQDLSSSMAARFKVRI